MDKSPIEEIPIINKKNNRRYMISLTILIVLICITIYILFHDYDLNLLRNYIRQMKIQYVILAFMMPLLYILFQSLSTLSITKRINNETNLMRNIFYTSVDYYFNSITPSATGGQPVVVYYMKKDGIPMSKSIIVVLFNTAAYKIILVLLSLFALIVAPSLLFGDGLLLPILFFLGLVLNVVIVLLCFMAMYDINKIRKISGVFLKIIAKFKKKKKEDLQMSFEIKLKEYAECGNFIKTHKRLFFEVFIFNLLQRVALFLVPLFIYKAFGLSDAPLIFLFCIQVIVAISVDSLPLPGGVGISEALLLLLYGIVYLDESMILPALLSTRIISYYFGVILTLILVIVNDIRVKIRKVRN